MSVTERPSAGVVVVSGPDVLAVADLLARHVVLGSWSISGLVRMKSKNWLTCTSKPRLPPAASRAPEDREDLHCVRSGPLP